MTNFNYQIGGSLPADAPSYIERQCDREYYELLKGGNYCYVFNCRQMGKSSLRVRVTHKLQAEGIVCATIDPQKIGVEVSCDQWYASAIRSLVGELNLKDRFDLRGWLKEREKYSPVQRFAEFIEAIVLKEIDTPIVIFVEEIDRLLSLKFGMDDFFGLVRSFFEDRPTKSDYKRLTFSFLGVATPTDLIQSQNVSAFNIGYAVEMTGFTLAEAMPLVQGLANKVANSQDYLEAAVHWTGGQPFLIQRLLGLIEKELEVSSQSPQKISAWVEELIQKRIVHNWESQDAPPHLMTIRDRVISVEEKLRGRMLGCYQQVLAGEELDDDRSEERSKLRLTGLVVRRDGKLRSYNPIYAAVFNNLWVEQQLADLRPEFYGSAFRAWREAEEGQNQGFLLRGQALEEAEVWSRGKRLSDVDEQFLRESRKFEKQEISLRLEAERQGREAAELSKRVEQQKREAAELAKEIQAKATESEQKLKHIYSLVVKSILSLSENPLQSQILAIVAADLNLSQFPNNIIDEVRLTLYQVIDIAKERNVLLSDHGIQAIAISPDSKIVAYACKNGVLRILDRSGNLIREFDKISSDIFSIAFSPDSPLIAVGSRTNIRLYDLAGNPNSNPFSIKSGINFQKIHLFFLWTIFDPVVATGKILGVFLLGLFFCSFLVFFLSEGLGMPYSASTPLSLSILSISVVFILLLALNKFGGHGTFTSLAFSPNGKYIVSGSSDNQLQLWNLTGKLVRFPFQGHKKRIMSVAFSPDSNYIASCSQDGTTKLWGFRGRLILDRYSLPTTSYVTSVAFSPNGKFIVSGNTDKNVILQDRKGDLPQIFRGHEDVVTSVVFSPDGKYIVSGSYDKTVRLWNIEGSPPRIFRGHEDVVTSVAFSPDGKYIVSGSSDKTVRFWDTQDNFSKDLLDCLYAACNILKDHPAIKNPQSIEASQVSKICQKYNSVNPKTQNNSEPLKI